MSVSLNDREVYDWAYWDAKEKVFRRDHNVCQYCGSHLTKYCATVDHLTPQALGGASEPHNLVTCCRECNEDKADTLPLDYLWYRLDRLADPVSLTCPSCLKVLATLSPVQKGGHLRVFSYQAKCKACHKKSKTAMIRGHVKIASDFQVGTTTVTTHGVKFEICHT